mgnify:FL=1|tara:strand:- start:12228 stop:12638 length:411 start_codon:yes stop_codon:yes gene_type:complete
MSARAVNLDNYLYSSNTPFDFEALFLTVDYPVGNVRAEFQVEKAGVVVYRVTSWENPTMFTITAEHTATQDLVSLQVLPTDASLDSLGTFGTVIGGDESEFDYRVDVGQDTDSITEYRFQGLMNVLESHGPYTSRV